MDFGEASGLEEMLGSRFILYGEWLYAKHSVHYRKLPHYFFEFDIYDKDAGQFLISTRVCECWWEVVFRPCRCCIVVASRRTKLNALIGASAFDSAFENPTTGQDGQLDGGSLLPH